MHKNPIPLLVRKTGSDIIHDPQYNKGTGYTLSERERLKLRGLLPPRTFPIEVFAMVSFNNTESY